VPRSSVLITGLRAPTGPGIELVEYLWPRDGRPYPEDALPNDLLYWQVTLQVDDQKELYDRLLLNKARFISRRWFATPTVTQSCCRNRLPAKVPPRSRTAP
jgi:hypothetical protein